jgi:hypothetical protein
MTKVKTTDLQMVLLLAASRRKTKSLHPLPAAAGRDGDAIDAAIGQLLADKLVAASEAATARQTWRTVDSKRIALVLTQAGRDVEAREASKGREDNERASKIGTVLCLLLREQGATLDELVTATGWLPHTTRAALTGLKKKGHVITRSKTDGVSRYTVSEAAS